MKNTKIFVVLISLLTLTSCEQLDKMDKDLLKFFNDTFSSNKSGSQTDTSNTSTYTKFADIFGIKSTEELYQEAMKIVKEKELEDKNTLEGLEEYRKSDFKEALESKVEDLREKPKNFLADPERLNTAQKDLQALFPNKKLKMHSVIYFTNDRIFIELYDPNNPGNVDEYQYEQDIETNQYKWVKGEPVKISSDDSFFYDPYILNINFTTANKVYKLIKERSKNIEGVTTPDSMYYNPGEWYTTLRTARADYSIKADENGNITEFKKN